MFKKQREREINVIINNHYIEVESVPTQNPTKQANKVK